MAATGWLAGWRIAGWTGFATLLIAAGCLVAHGFSEDALRAYVRNSARLSLVLFLLAFSASSAQALFRQSWSAWLLRNRRYLGVSFAISHGGHLLALILLALYFPHPFLDRLTLSGFIGGSLGYVFILGMTITSFAGPRKWLGEKRWHLLHTTGSYYLWLVFMQSYAGRASKEVAYLPFVLALLLVLLLRLWRRYARQ